MATDLMGSWFRGLAELRFAPTKKRLRAWLADDPTRDTVLDTTDALLVWEPKRVVPSYAVPLGDLSPDFAQRLTEHDPAPVPPDLGPVLPPIHPEWHTTPGRSWHAEGLGEVAFRPDDADLGGRVILLWETFRWLEEEVPVVSHPHDPFSRIDVLPSDRHVVVTLAHGTPGEIVLADSTRPVALFETRLPVRWYLPRDDVRMDLLTPSDTETVCAYKGAASYLSAEGAPDVAWHYPDPLHDAEPVKDLLSFWGACTVSVDGEPVGTAMPGEPG